MPKSAPSSLSWRRSVAWMVPLVMGSSKDLPVRLSVRVTVSRGMAEASAFLDFDGDCTEFIGVPEEPEPSGGSTLHQAARGGNGDGEEGSGGRQAAGAGGWWSRRMRLLTIVVITIIMPADWEVDHDADTTQPRAGALRPRLAEYVPHVFVR